MDRTVCGWTVGGAPPSGSSIRTTFNFCHSSVLPQVFPRTFDGGDQHDERQRDKQEQEFREQTETDRQKTDRQTNKQRYTKRDIEKQRETERETEEQRET